MYKQQKIDRETMDADIRKIMKALSRKNSETFFENQPPFENIKISFRFYWILQF